MARELLQPGAFYHIYNHAVGSDRLFRSDENYHYFLRRYQHFIGAVVDTYVCQTISIFSLRLKPELL
jgi:hypothetical protein